MSDLTKTFLEAGKQVIRDSPVPGTRLMNWGDSEKFARGWFIKSIDDLEGFKVQLAKMIETLPRHEFEIRAHDNVQSYEEKDGQREMQGSFISVVFALRSDF